MAAGFLAGWCAALAWLAWLGRRWALEAARAQAAAEAEAAVIAFATIRRHAEAALN